jgi:hypothetical protein
VPVPLLTHFTPLALVKVELNKMDVVFLQMSVKFTVETVGRRLIRTTVLSSAGLQVPLPRVTILKINESLALSAVEN